MNNYFEETTRTHNSSTSKFFRGMMEEQGREMAIEKGVHLAAKRVEEIAKETDEETKLALELVESKRRRFVDEKTRQRIRETNQELKELEMKLRSAYVGKALAAQIAEKEAIRLQAKFLHEQENDLLEAARVKDAEYHRINLELERQRKKHNREEMIEQMAMREQERAKKYEEFLAEKKILDDIVRKMYDEEMAEMRAKAEKQIQFKKDIENYLCMQRMWREQHKQETDDEDQKILALLKIREAEVKEMERKKLEQRALREECSEKIGQEILAIAEEKRKHQDLLIDLQVAEIDEKEQQSIRQNLEKQLRQRIQTRLQLELQREDNIKRRAMESEEDRIFREEQLRIYAERDKLDLMSNEKRRRKIMEHRRDTQSCLDEKKRRRAEEMALLLKERDEAIEEEHNMQQLIEEERIRMLKEHATALMGFLPPGILRESDRKFLPLPPKS